MTCSGNQQPVRRRAQKKGKKRKGLQEENLAGALGGFHRHGEELLLRHAVLRSLAPVILVSSPATASTQQQFWPLASAFLGIVESRRAVLDVRTSVGPYHGNGTQNPKTDGFLLYYGEDMGQFLYL